jgi:hypothetical protein
LSTDEAFESIGADMPDHDRRPSRAHLLPRVLMNTRRRARGFRSISTELQIFFEILVNQILNLEDIPRESLAFCMQCYA